VYLLEHVQNRRVYLDEGTQRFIHFRESAKEVHGQGKEIHFCLLVRVSVEDHKQGRFSRLQVFGLLYSDSKVLRILGAKIGSGDGPRY